MVSLGGEKVVFKERTLHALQGQKKALIPLQGKRPCSGAAQVINMGCSASQVPCLQKTGNHLSLLMTSFR